jgi:hypothetical protein
MFVIAAMPGTATGAQAKVDPAVSAYRAELVRQCPAKHL